MELKSLLQFDKIVIQCHNDPDADALASGYAVWSYLRDHQKEARFVYGGRHPVQKSNLLRMIERLGIQVDYVRELAEEPDLLLMVDCQPGERNVQPFSGKKVAAIDHHVTKNRNSLESLWDYDIRENYGSCATIVWDLLRREELRAEHNEHLATALYYGLFMDTCKLQEIYQMTDRKMRDELELRCNEAALTEFKMNNLSSEELRLVGRALASCEHIPSQRYAIARANRCDPNLLGIIGDQLIEADEVDLCIVYTMQDGGAKLSIRTCSPEVRADDVANYLTGGGGHERKAGGLIPFRVLDCDEDSPEVWDRVHDLLISRMDEYFRTQQVIRIGSQAGEQLDLSKEPLYQKKPVEMGYIRAADVYPLGARVQVRMLEGDGVETVTEDLYFMVGVKNEVYPTRREKLLANYTLTERPFPLPEGKAGQLVEDSVNAIDVDDAPLEGHIFVCIPKNNVRIRGKQLTRRTKLFPAGKDSYLFGNAGAWLVAQEKDLSDVYIIQKDIFDLTYEEVT